MDTLVEKGPALRGELEKAGTLVPDLLGLTGEEFDGALTAHIEKARADLKAAQDAQSLEERRAELVEGQPCPLCGSQDHPWAEGSPLSSLVGSRKALVSSLEHMEREIGKLAPVVQDTRARLKDSLQAFQDWEERLDSDPEGFKKDLSEKVDRFRRETRHLREASPLLIRVDAQLPSEERARLLDGADAEEGGDEGRRLADLLPDLEKAREERAGAKEKATLALATVKALTDQVKDLDSAWEAQSKDLKARAEAAQVTRWKSCENAWPTVRPGSKRKVGS